MKRESFLLRKSRRLIIHINECSQIEFELILSDKIGAHTIAKIYHVTKYLNLYREVLHHVAKSNKLAEISSMLLKTL